MEPLKIVDATRTVGKPEDWIEELDGECISLDVWDYIDSVTGIPFQRTAWNPTEEELDALNKGWFG